MTRYLRLIDGGNGGPRNEIAWHLRRKWGVFFRNARIKHGLSSEDLDRSIGLMSGTYAAWESGFRSPKAKMLGQILAHFDMDTNLEFQDLFNQLQYEAAVLRGIICYEG